MEQLCQFKVPSEEERLKAMGNLSNLKQDDQMCMQSYIKFFKPIKQPDKSDWLSEHIESGQTYNEFAQSQKIITNKHKKFIYIVPMEPCIDESFVQKLKIFSATFFTGLGIKFLQQLDIKSWDIPSRINDKKKQYNASSILNKLKDIKPKDAYCIIAILLTDIYPRESWNFVFGLASLEDKVGVFSFARYQDSFYNERATKNDIDKVIYRSCKVMCHELLHQFGIKHCIYYQCLMNGSNHIEESTNKPFQLCPVCLRKLQYKLQFDIQGRFSELKQACLQINNPYFESEFKIYQQYIEDFNQISIKKQVKKQVNN